MDANLFTEIYRKLKATDTQENADFIIKSKRTYQEGAACFICKKNYILMALKLTLTLKLG